MATYTLMKDELKTCPFNPNHRVAARRFQAHIIKCQRNESNPILADCPFNALHKVPKDDLQHHILLCKDSRQVIREMEESRARPVESRSVAQRSEVAPSKDDWDLEVDPSQVKTYVIPGLLRVKEEEGIERPFTIKSNIEIQCMTRSERQKYYKELNERAKKGELEDLTHKSRIAKQEAKLGSIASGSQMSIKSETASFKSEDKVDPNYVRKPTINPFVNPSVGGIGRGSTPSNRFGVGRGIGRGRGFGSPDVNTPNVKREREDDHSMSKRFENE